MSARTLRGAKLFERPDLGTLDISIEGERITGIAAAGTYGEIGQVTDVHGLSVLPGFIDSHVHPIHDETGGSVGRAGAAGGVTTALLHLYPGDEEGIPAAVQRMTQEASAGTADFGLHIRLTPGILARGAAGLGDVGAVGVKMFMAHPDPRAQVGLDDLAKGMSVCAHLGLPVVVHAEFGDLINALPELTHVDVSTMKGLGVLRSPEIEASAIRAAALVARITGARLYIPHVSGALPLGAILEERQRGTDVIAETCPHYLFLNAETISGLGGLGKVLPPLRSGYDESALLKAIAAKTIDIVASDHCGHGPEAKFRDDIGRSKAGLPGIQQLGSLLIDEALSGTTISRGDVVAQLCHNPASVFQLGQKGHIAVGADADLVFVDEASTTTVSAADTLDASTYSAYEGAVLRGRIVNVWRRGVAVAADGKLLVESGGKLQKRHSK